MNTPVQIEVCADSVASAVAAERGGATRIELCSDLIEGGITPSAGLIATVRAAVSIPVHVMIRPRAGDFLYSDDEFAIMKRDIALAKQMRADGLVLGILDLDGRVDVDRTRRLVESAHPLSVTFHRAVDMAADMLRALEDVRATGANRILTSGGEQTACHGREMIAKLVANSQGKIAIMAGSGIKPENARELVARTGVKEIHVGLRSTIASTMRFRNDRISMGTVADREYRHFVVLEEQIRRLCQAVSADDHPQENRP